MLKFVIPSILTNEFTVGALLAVTGSAFGFGLILSLVYLFSCRCVGKSFFTEKPVNQAWLLPFETSAEPVFPHILSPGNLLSP